MLKEVIELIQVRSYVVNAISLPAISRKEIKELNEILLLLDNKIINILTGPDFKSYIGYENIQELKVEAVKNSNIYSGIKQIKK